MATKKDLVEAYSFSRRRLVTAFVSGAPGGREVEPTRPGRTIIGGIALAILLIAGAAVAGVFKSRPDVDWTEPGLISETETGADYVIVAIEDGDDPELRPIANITSAWLILGRTEPEDVAREEIEKQRRGELIGILGAPETPPETGSLVETGWTACTGTDYDTGDDLGLKVNVSDTDAVEETPTTGMLVRSERGDLYVVAESQVPGQDVPEAHSYRVPDDVQVDTMMGSLAQTSSDQAVDVPDNWLSLFPAGGDLGADSFPVEGLGERPRGLSGLPGNAKVGDFYYVGEEMRVILDDRVAPLDPFAAAVYVSSRFAGYQPKQRPITADPGGSQDRALVQAAGWPNRTLDAKTSGEYCAVLQTGDGADVEPRVLIGSAAVGGESSAADVPARERDVNVDTGHGAVVRAGDFQAQGDTQPFLLDDRGVVYSIAGDLEITQLGYDGVDDAVVPESWMDLFEAGIDLSRDAALCPPTSAAPAPSAPDGESDIC